MLKKLILGSMLSAAALLAAPCCNGGVKQSETAGCKSENAKGCTKSQKSNKGCDKNKGCMSGKGCATKVGFPKFIATELELTADQKAKIADISKKYADKMNEAPKGCEAKPMNFVKDGKFDKEAFVAKHNEATASMGKLKADMFEEIFATLNDKQKAELSDIISFKK